MNKKIIAASLCAIITVSFFSGCKSTEFTPEVYSPVAIVTVNANYSLPWVVEEKDRTNEEDGKISNSSLNVFFNSLLNSSDPEILTAPARTDMAGEIIRNTFINNGFEVIPVEKVYETPSIKKSRLNFLNSVGGFKPATGYKTYENPSSKREKDICSFTGAKSTMYFILEFRKEKKQTGFLTSEIRAHVTLKANVTDSRGKKILKDSYVGISSDCVIMDNKNYDRNEVVELYPEAIQNAMNLFMEDLTGKKVADYIPEAPVVEEPKISEEQRAQATKITLPKKGAAEEIAVEKTVEETVEE